MFVEKQPPWFIQKVEVKKSDLHGIGVFATETIERHEIIERAPVILFHKSIIEDFCDFHEITRHHLDDYLFQWGDGQLAAALGFAMIYNHSDDPNIITQKMKTDLDKPRIAVVAKRNIEAGEECCWHYLGQSSGDVIFDVMGTFYRPTSGINLRGNAGTKTGGAFAADAEIKNIFSSNNFSNARGFSTRTADLEEESFESAAHLSVLGEKKDDT